MSEHRSPETINQGSAQKGGVYILRIATVLLAIVSWWATAQGMKNYVFSTNWQSYLASLAIQSILLGLNFYLPTFWRYTSSGLTKLGIALLSFIVLLCSSWFSYVYIVQRAYDESWNSTSQLLVQSTYRQELYEALDYSEEYDEVLRGSIGSQINSIYAKAKDVEAVEKHSIEPFDPTADLDKYANNTEFFSSREVDSAIQIMENALREDASANDRELAAEQLLLIITQIESEIDTLKNDIERTDAAITSAERNLRSAQDRLTNAVEGQDIEALERAVDSATQNYESQQARKREQEDNLNDCQTALRLLNQYLTRLNISSGGSGTQISSALRDIQSNILEGSINLEDTEKKVREIFEQIQASDDTLSADVTTYQELMNEIESFIRSIQNYSLVKASMQTLQGLSGDIPTESESVWKEQWLTRLVNLKSAIGSMPSYIGTESQALSAYNRATSMNNLDDAIQKYIFEHNVADQALIYFSTPYRSLAIFSLVLALFLDLAAFVTGFIIDVVDQHQMKMASALQSEALKDEYAEAEVEDRIPLSPTARRYIYLIGDYVKEDEHFYYQALEDGTQIEVELPKAGFQPGFLVETATQFSLVEPQELIICQAGKESADGIYHNVRLQYSDDILYIKKDNQQDFTYLVSEFNDIPVYQVRKNDCILGSIQDIPPQLWNTAIVALNGRGTHVAAIYLN